jgi:hypothetical protein
MRKEQNITAVTLSLVVAAIREIKAVVSFARTGLHLWLQRMPLGMPVYLGSLSDDSHLRSAWLLGDSGRINPHPGNQRGNLQLQPVLAFTSCRGTASA